MESKIQITFTSWEGKHIMGDDKEGCVRRVALPSSLCYLALPSLLKEGCKLNILDATTDEDGILHPHNIIFEPDYLIDISSLSRCVQSYGAPAIGYILNIFEIGEESAARLLGEAANMFLDDCVNDSSSNPASYKNSITSFFREYPLQLSVCEGIDRQFFATAQEQFYNIQQTMGKQTIEMSDSDSRDTMQLEPSFFCETLGLQGRIDLLYSDNSLLIELKSGKADEYNKTAKEEHRLQMSLYKEMLCYNLNIPRNSIKARLLYSRYPLFFGEESSPDAISRALMLRNKIVSLLLLMGREGLRDILEGLTPEALNESGTTSRLWTNYQRPRIEKILAPIAEADELLREYLFGNLAFVAREMQIAKIGGNRRNESGRCFADVWNSDVETKKDNGNILTDLTIKSICDSEGVSDIIFDIPCESDSFFPNFRAGDTVFIYRRDGEEDNATNHQVMRGSLTSITPKELTLHLRHKQRNRTLFSSEARYAIEHDHLDSTFRASLRDLYSLLSAPQQRIELLLARREPQTDKSRTLNGDYGNSYINDIVLKAKQARDLFMLVGPPGTGKTSQALSSMVRELLTDAECNILLASYTNRAVDEICQTLERLPEKPSYIRIGNEQSCLQQYRPHLLKNMIAHCNNREEIRNTMHSCRIIVGTIASLTARKELFKLKKFHAAIIDEATQILESQLAGLMAATSPDGTSAIEKFILIGDPKQLPAVVAQPAAHSIVKSKMLNGIGITDYGMSLFERMYQWYYNSSIEGLTATLSLQGRMHPIVGEFANRYFYGDTLHPIPLPHQSEELTFDTFDSNDSYQTLLATRRTAFIATKPDNGNGNPKTNRNEADEIARFVKAYHTLHCANGTPCDPSQEIGIIVPFRNQIAMVTRAIAELEIPQSEGIVIDTVERFQGSQREMILFGTTISTTQQLDILSCPVKDAGGTLVDRKLNVAVTRARRRMYIFGNPEILSASPLYKALIEELGQTSAEA